MTNNLINLTTYVATWNWQLLAMMFLSFSIISFILPRTNMSAIFYVVFFLLFVACEFISLKRRKEFYKDEE